MNIGSNMSSSDKGKLYNTAKGTSYEEKSDKVLWDGFDKITENSDTTEDEKALAKLGKTIASHTMDWTEHDDFKRGFLCGNSR